MERKVSESGHFLRHTGGVGMGGDQGRVPELGADCFLIIFAIHPAIVSYVVVLGTKTLSVFLSVLLLASSLLERGRWPLMGAVCGLMWVVHIFSQDRSRSPVHDLWYTIANQ